MVAALIGAGGFGALVFQGVSSSAVDLVMLGVIPVVVLSMVTDVLTASYPAVVDATQRCRATCRGTDRRIGTSPGSRVDARGTPPGVRQGDPRYPPGENGNRS